MNEFAGYEPAHEEAMRLYCRSLPEDHRRRYGAIKAMKIGDGGVAYFSRVLGMSRRKIYTGMRELEHMGEDDPDHPQRTSGDAERVRRPVDGRPPITEREPLLETTLHEVLDAYSAGSPTDERVRWTDLNPLKLVQELVERGFEICRNTAAELLERAGFRRRALCKEWITGYVDPLERDQQFRHLADGVLVAHGVYDVVANVSFITLGTLRETSAFVCDVIALAWEVTFRHMYPHATESVLLCDCGGANAASSLCFKEDLIELAGRLGLRLRP